MEEQGEADRHSVFHGENDLGGALYEQGMADGGFVRDDVTGAFLVDGKPLYEVQ